MVAAVPAAPAWCGRLEVSGAARRVQVVGRGEPRPGDMAVRAAHPVAAPAAPGASRSGPAPLVHALAPRPRSRPPPPPLPAPPAPARTPRTPLPTPSHDTSRSPRALSGATARGGRGGQL